MQPNDKVVGDNPYHWKCCHDDNNYVIYLANPTGETPRTDNPAPEKPTVHIVLPLGSYVVKWFNPKTGKWFKVPNISGLKQTLVPPGKAGINWGDWVVLLQKIH